MNIRASLVLLLALAAVHMTSASNYYIDDEYLPNRGYPYAGDHLDHGDHLDYGHHLDHGDHHDYGHEHHHHHHHLCDCCSYCKPCCCKHSCSKPCYCNPCYC